MKRAALVLSFCLLFLAGCGVASHDKTPPMPGRGATTTSTVSGY